MPTALEPGELARFFYQNGYVTGIDVLNAQELLEVRGDFDRVQNQIGEDEATYSLHNKHMDEEWILKIATHPKMLKPLKVILGPNIMLLDSRFICKYPVKEDQENEAFVAWHQDVRYWGIEGDVVSAWLAVDDADEGNACMQVIPATHKSGILEHVSMTGEGNLLTSNQAIPEHLYDVGQSVHCCLKAGQMSLHHGHLVHGSATNRSTRRRCGYVIRYVATTSRPIDDVDRPRKFLATVLVSGDNQENLFQDHAPAWYTWKA